MSARVIPVVGLVGLAVLPFLTPNPFVQHVLVMCFYFSFMGLAWNILGGFAGQLSLGHAAFHGIGAYTSTLLYLHHGVSPWIGMLAGGLLAAVVAGLISLPCFRLRGPFFTLATIAFGEVMRIAAIYFRDITNGSNGLLIRFDPGFANLIFTDKRGYTYTALAFMLAGIGISRLIQSSKLGYYLVSIREDEDAAEAIGVNPRRYKLYATLVSAFLTAMAGTFYAQYILFIEPYSEFSVDLSVLIALVAMAGGLGTTGGMVVGGVVIIVLQEVLRTYLGEARQGLNFFLYGVTLLLVVMAMPKGIYGFLRERAEAMRVRAVR